MLKTFIKSLFLVFLYLLLIATVSSAQTITVGTVDPGPYGTGSTITLPIQVDNTSGCIVTGNTFRLFLSDASGSFATATPIGTFSGFYGTFVNGIIPVGTPAGTGYRLRVSSSLPAVNSTVSAPFSINAVVGVSANISSQLINNNSPEVFGVCIANESTPPPPYDFINTSTAGANVTANFFNELTQVTEATNKPIPSSFAADFANYTITVKAEKGGIIGTKSFILINNVVNNAFSVSGSTTVCLNNSSQLAYNVIITGSQGIQRNYPGLSYNVNWGDGTIENYTYCDIIKAGGKVVHSYTTPSCGKTANGQNNVFKVDLQPVSPYCSNIVTPLTSYAKVLTPPRNEFTHPIAACVGSEVTFVNTSDPGQDPTSNMRDCKSLTGKYTWYVDGVAVQTNYAINQPFKYTFLTNKIYKVKLRLQNGSVGCSADDKEYDICVQKSPEPNFTIPTNYCLATGPLTPVNTSVVDEACNTNTTYNWVIVNGPVGGVTFDASAKTPSFNFTQAGAYKIRLDITTLSCGTVAGPVKDIIVNDVPTAVLSADGNECGKGVTLSFDPSATTTKTTLNGTTQALPTTYVWTVTSANGGTFAYEAGSTANSQYPRIIFNDYDTYTIKIVHTNNCGPQATDTQVLTFVAAPTVSAGPPQPNVCEGTPVILSGTPGVGGLVTSVKWVSPTGGVFSTPNSQNTTYTPTTADIANGQVSLLYQVTTSLAAPCNIITSTVPITIIKKATVTSQNSASVCSGSNFQYTITSANPATTFTWAAALTSGTATGFNLNGSGNSITDVITNTSTTDAVVTYTITPALNGCAGTPLLLKLTVHPLPVLTATAVDAEICSNQPANITLASNIAGTTYIWESTASTPGITGNTNRTVASAATSIQDVLVNTSALPGTVTYKITPYNGTCPGLPKQVVLTVKPLPIPSVPGPDESICAAATYTLKGNDPSPGTGKWTVTLGQAGVSFSDNTSPNAIASGLVPGQVYKFTWTITAAPTCPPSVGTVTITNDLGAVAGVTSGTTVVCEGANNGQVKLTGHTGNITWQISTNGGTTWANIVPAQTSAVLTYNNLTQTTLYRAAVTNGACGTNYSTATTITVNPQSPIANAGTYTPFCNVASITLTGNDPGLFAGVWTQVEGPIVNILTPNNFQTQVTGLTGGIVYKFRWTIKATPPCVDSWSEATITNDADVTANFTPSQTQVCGSTSVLFTNNSTPALPGTVYEWDFGDRSPVSNLVNPSHPFQPAVDGKDIIYHVKLTIVGNCVVSQRIVDITVSPAKPVAAIAPVNLQACGTFDLTVHNLSPGSNASYEFFLIDENRGLIAKIGPLFNKADAVFPSQTPIKAALWHVYMVATDKCGNTSTSPENDIPVSPSNVIPGMQIKNGISAVCLGTPVVFQNISTGGDLFTYNILDADRNTTIQIVGGTSDFPYTFTRAGNYKVSITARNNGCTGAPTSATKDIEVYALPQPRFTFITDVNNKVTFTNTTPAIGTTPPASLNYQWDFGDGSPVKIGFTPTDHIYDYTKSPYTVTLTATNPVTTCQGVIKKTIEIKFTGELFLPNAFQPTSNKSELRVFMAKGQKLKQWNLQIFNNWGQLIWQTTKLGSDGEPVEGWDGTFKGAVVQQGTYVWQASATFLNGSEWKGASYNGSLPKRSGYIHLIK